MPASVFFSSDPGNPDTFGHFHSDIQMYTAPMRQPDPGLFIQQYLSENAANKENKWLGRNISRWRNSEFDGLYEASEQELDPVKRATLFIKMNDLIINDVAAIPIVFRQVATGLKNGLVADLSSWDSYLWRLSHWHRKNA